MRLIILLFCTVFIFNTCYSQQKYSTNSKKAIKYYEAALAAFNMMDYPLVQAKLNDAIKKDPNFIDAYLLRAELYRINRNYYYQITDLQKAIDIDPTYFPFMYFTIASAQWSIGEYNSAKYNYTAYVKMKTGKKSTINRAYKFINKCDFAINLVNNPVTFEPKSLSKNINTSNSQYWPSLSIDGNTIIYSTMLIDSTQRTISGSYAHQEDFYISNKINDEWVKGKPMGPPINTPGNEGALKLSADGNTIVFTACNRPDGYGRCDIYFAYKTRNGWSNADNAGPSINSKYSEKQPCLSADGKTLYFSSDRKGGFGEMDIWYSEINERGLWSNPINMDSIINTKYSEESPFIHPDNRTFYFSSNGHWGLGMHDIFYSHKNDSNEWSKPENIGYPINTYRDEIGLFIDNTGTNAYFSSNYNNSSLNIYKFTMPEKARPLAVSYLSGIIYDQETNSPLEARIELLNTTTGKIIMDVDSDKKTGGFLICLPGGSNYALNASCEGYLFKSVHFNLSEMDTHANTYKKDISLQRVKINESIVLKTIFFPSNSFDLMPESTAGLIKIEEFIKKNPNLIFEIGGHTDKSGIPEYNLTLSEKRAKTVYDYLINKGINSNSISFKGYGETQPISEKNTNIDRALNRRTELKIVDNN